MSKMKNYLLDQYENQQGGGQLMRGYEIQKIETYYVEASSASEAAAKVANTDNGSALRVDYRVTYVGAEICLICSSAKDDNGLTICSECNSSEIGSCDTCGGDYELASRDGRCGDCGNCSDHCQHKEAANEAQ